MLTAFTLLFAIPAVVLSAEHEAMCRVAVGEEFPAIEGLEKLRGPRATVVAVPGGAKWMDAMLSGDLSGDFAPKYGSQGVALVTLDGPALGEGVSALQVDRAKLNASLGEGRGPRVYVLDGAGKVVWFDLEYTLSTHRELHAALDELVGK